MLYLIHHRLCEIFISDDYFGGKLVLLVGDIMQLKPCKGGRFIFDKPKNSKHLGNMKCQKSLETTPSLCRRLAC